jgi:hypothetical protein
MYVGVSGLQGTDRREGRGGVTGENCIRGADGRDAITAEDSPPLATMRTIHTVSPSRGQDEPHRVTVQADSHRCSHRLPPTMQPPTPAAVAAATTHLETLPRAVFFSWGSSWSLFSRWREGANRPEWLGYLPGPAQPHGTSWPGPFFFWAKIFWLESMPSGPGMAEMN